MMRPSNKTILTTLNNRVQHRSAQAAFTVVEQSTQRTLTYGDLLSSSRLVATNLKNLGLHRGDRVLVCLPTSVELLTAIYGILMAGGVCVPVYPPIAAKGFDRWKARATAIVRIAQPAGAIVDRPMFLHMQSVLAQQGDGLFTTTPTKLNAPHQHPDEPVPVEPEDLAFIQFTSGTTAQPRGVAISHASLMANIEALVSGMQLGRDDISVSWLPPYHDMGLVGHIFTPIQGAVHQYLMSPEAFLVRPSRWLQLITEVRATQTTAPNAAYEMCIRRITEKDKADLDLRSLRWALNGAELVRPDTLDRFCRAFAPCGFAPSALRPVYGLAETTLAATLGPVGGPRIDRIDRDHLFAERIAVPFGTGPNGETVLPDLKNLSSFVSVGRPIPSHEIKIVDDGGAQQETRCVGEICFRGPSVMQSYFNNPQATTSALDESGWLKTGDLGYLDENGELFVTGRIKELIIKNGRNYLPHDFEAACTSVPGLRAGRAVAFGLPNEQSGTEDVVIVAETRAPNERATGTLRHRVIVAVTQSTGVRPDRVELLDPGTLPKTTSGKLKRGTVKAAYRDGAKLTPAEQNPLRDTVTANLRSLAGLVVSRCSRLLGWQT